MSWKIYMLRDMPRLNSSIYKRMAD